MLGAAFVGGVILNVMPCVLPVLAMKVFHMIEHAGDDRRSHHRHGMAYIAGVLTTFAVFALAVVLLRRSGEAVGWGMHFQNPSFLAVLVSVIFAFGLNALGVFEISFSLRAEQGKGGYMDSFVNGVVASIMSTPCSAPFLGSAAIFALGAETSDVQTFVILSMVGVGLAFPFGLVSFIPAVARVLPRPGAWMETFKHLMGFSLLGAAVWLFGTMVRQLDDSSIKGFTAFLLVLGMGLWVIGHFGDATAPTLRRRLVTLAAAAGVAIFGWRYVELRVETIDHGYVEGAGVVVDDRINWAPFEVERIEAALASQRPVFMDYTADWCANCKANERLFIEVPRFRRLLEQTQILPVKADMTNEQPVIQEWLNRLGRSGIPAYVIYFPDGTFDLLPTQITSAILEERIEEASHRYPPERFTANAAPDAPATP
jgi:thiol:disulfide interchange protein DsbD